MTSEKPERDLQLIAIKHQFPMIETPRSCDRRGPVFGLRRSLGRLALDGRRGANALHILHVDPQDFSHTPSLCYASTRPLRSVAVENF